MEIRNIEMPSKIRKRRFPTGSSSSFANNSLAQFFVEKSGSPEKCEKPGGDDRVVEVLDGLSMNVGRSRNMSRSSPSRGLANEVMNAHHRHASGSSFMEKDKSVGGMALTCDVKQMEGKSRHCGETEVKAKKHESEMLNPRHGLEEIKHSLTVSKELLKVLTRVWTADTNHEHQHPTGMSLASTLNHELNKARSYVNKLIQEQRAENTLTHEPKEQDKIRVAVKTVSRELENERKLRRQTERMNKKLGRELANTKASLAKAIKKAESEKQATEMLEQLCEKMAHSIEEDRVELEELKKESEKVREEMEEEREMLRVADLLREERVQMKLTDAKYEYEDKHKQLNVLVQDLEELLEDENGIEHLKRTPKVLSWYQSTVKNKGSDDNANIEDTIHSLWYENKISKGNMINHENTLDEEISGLSWFENNKSEVINGDITNLQNELIGRNSDCIELEFGLDLKNGSEDLNECSEERVLGFSGSSTLKEYEDEMERYKMIKDLRDRIVSGSDLSRDTLDFGSYM